MPQKPQIVMQNIRSLKLGPTDILIFQFDQLPSAAVREEFERTVAQALWGIPNKVIILHGRQQIGTFGEHQLFTPKELDFLHRLVDTHGTTPEHHALATKLQELLK